MKEYKLKNCPFCNRQVKLHGAKLGRGIVYWVQCRCGVQIKGSFNAQNVVDRWNMRFRGRPGEKRVKIDMHRYEVEDEDN